MEMDFMGRGFMEMFSFEPDGTEKDPGRPERPFPLRPGSGFDKGFASNASNEDDGYPVDDENDLIFMANISWGHVASEVAEIAFEILSARSAQMEGDFYGG